MAIGVIVLDDVEFTQHLYIVGVDVYLKCLLLSW